MLLDTPTESNLLANLRACRARKLDLCKICFDGQHATTGARRADVDEQKFILGQLGDLRLLLVFRLYTKQAAKQEQRDLELWRARLVREHLTSIFTSDLPVYTCGSFPTAPRT